MEATNPTTEAPRRVGSWYTSTPHTWRIFDKGNTNQLFKNYGRWTRNSNRSPSNPLFSFIHSRKQPQNFLPLVSILLILTTTNILLPLVQRGVSSKPTILLQVYSWSAVQSSESQSVTSAPDLSYVTQCTGSGGQILHKRDVLLLSTGPRAELGRLWLPTVTVTQTTTFNAANRYKNPFTDNTSFSKSKIQKHTRKNSNGKKKRKNAPHHITWLW